MVRRDTGEVQNSNRDDAATVVKGSTVEDREAGSEIRRANTHARPECAPAPRLVS
jgi:hypothetical protein